MNHNYSTGRFFVEACTVHGAPPVVRVQYRIRDKDYYAPRFGARVVAYTHDAAIAEQICAMLNDVSPPKPAATADADKP